MEPKQIVAIIVFVVILASIPLSFMLLKNSQILSSRASEIKTNTLVSTSSAKLREVPKNSTLDDLKAFVENSTTPTPAPSGSITPTLTPTPTINLAFGPILNAKIILEGKSLGKMSGKVFIGLSSGNPTTKPTYLLSFTVDFPDSGEFSGISLAGLNPGSTYTAYLKGPSQIDQASTFVMSPTTTNLNNNQPLTLLSGDLNEDNTINATDLAIIKGSYGALRGSSMWNERADINGDGVINNIDLAYVNKNYGKTGSSGIWYSPPPQASGSASLNIDKPVGGYWLWLPPQ